MLRVIAVVAGMASALPAMGGEMTASEARHFVAGNLFSYACFDGTRGLARVHPRFSNLRALGQRVTARCRPPPCASRVSGSAHRYRTRSSSPAFTWSAPMPRASAARYRDLALPIAISPGTKSPRVSCIAHAGKGYCRKLRTNNRNTAIVRMPARMSAIGT